jgi:hypothetical protein
MKKLVADTIVGVYEVEEFPDLEVTIDEDMFFDELTHVEDGEQIACNVSEEMYNKISEKFGIGRTR